MARVVVVGAGVVGTATGKGFAAHGHDVEFCDIDPGRVACLESEGYKASTTVDLSGPAATVFLIVPTPARDGRYDLGALRAATTAVGDALRQSDEFHTVVVRSTVAPGTCDGVVLPILEQRSGKELGVHFALASNPEFLRSASALDDFLAPWMTVVGARSPATTEHVLDLYRPFGGEFRAFPSPVEAEFVKCAHNLYNATKISFWNEMWSVSRELGVDGDDIASTVARSAEGSFNPEYGIHGGRPFGGACLPKDTEGFLGFAAENGFQMPLLASVVAVNEALIGAEEPSVATNGAAARNGSAHNGAAPAGGSSGRSFDLLDLHP